MRASLLIVGQGLAGTVLAHACERAGIAFEIADAGHAHAASRVGAGIINPITGQRIVKSWRIDELRPLAHRVYREIGDTLGLPVMREMRVRRLFRNDEERRIFADKAARGEFDPYANATSADAEGFWIEGALRVDTAALIAATRVRWLKAGVLREERIDVARTLAEARYETIVVCAGAESDGDASNTRRYAWAGVKCAQAIGEILALAVAGLAPDVILNDGHWLLPSAAGEARFGATYTRDVPSDSAAARIELQAGARRILARFCEGTRGQQRAHGDDVFKILGQESGVRVTAPDRRPLAGRDAREPRVGIINGLGSKGTLLAPWIAAEWVAHLKTGAAFSPEIALSRFG